MLLHLLYQPSSILLFNLQLSLIFLKSLISPPFLNPGRVITPLRPTIAQCRLRAFSAKCSNVLPLTNCCGTSTCILVYTIINLASGPSDQQCRSWTLAVNDWTLARDVGHTTVVAFIDLSKAFDQVVHQELIFTLHSLGIHSSALKWFASYLNGRHQRVYIASGTSSLLPVTRGVPQGTILRPTLFNLYVRLLPDLAAGSGAKLLMFADDKTLYASSRDPIVCAYVVSSALAKIHNELRSLGMSVNVDKTVVMRILPKNAPDVQRPVLVELGGTTLREHV